jgi:hypothetical protein
VKGVPCRDVSLLKWTRSLLEPRAELFAEEAVSGACNDVVLEAPALTWVRGMEEAERKGEDEGEGLGMHAVGR